MIQLQPYTLPEVVDREHLRQWRNALPRKVATGVPHEVLAFINTIAYLLGDFAKYKTEKQYMRGADLLLCGVEEWNGETINTWTAYEIEVPVLQAVDHHAAMLRIFARKGKQGLIDYCRARVKSSQLKRVLETLEVEVFHFERPEFKAVMDAIQTSKQLEGVL